MAVVQGRKRGGRPEANSARDLDVLLTMAAHELRSPVAATQMALQAAIAADYRSADGARLLSRALRQTKDLGSLIDSMLDASMLRKGALVLRREPIELAEIVEQAADCLALQTHGSDTEVVLRLNDRGWGWWDRVRMGQLVTNLLTNAVKHGGPGLIEVVLERRAPDRIVLHVSDEGPGISDEDRQRVFKLFGRGSRATRFGLGIGLFVVREVARAHGATLSIERHVGSGTVVSVELPAPAAVRHGPNRANGK